ncbi:MAG: hypothetical protein ACRCV4_03850 [Hafnia alvei]
MKEDVANQLFEKISQLELAVKRLSVRTDLMPHMIAYTAVATGVSPKIYSEQLELMHPTGDVIGLKEVLECEKAHIDTELNKVFAKVEKFRQQL